MTPLVSSTLPNLVKPLLPLDLKSLETFGLTSQKTMKTGSTHSSWLIRVVGSHSSTTVHPVPKTTGVDGRPPFLRHSRRKYTERVTGEGDGRRVEEVLGVHTPVLLVYGNQCTLK